MTGTADKSVEALEQAILARAQELADELVGKAEHKRDMILRESNDRLSLAEERENASALAKAERAQRRHVQADELRLQARLDRLRWELVQGVQVRLGEHLRALRQDREGYRQWLIRLIGEAAHLLPDGDLLAEVAVEDHAWLQQEWSDLVERAAPGRRIVLASEPVAGSGGVRLRNADNSAQLNNLFEGRLARLEAGVQRVILERLFPVDGSPGDLGGVIG